MNVGPDGNGVIPDASVKILKEIGAWMKINGEAIYGTGRWTTMKEGPTGLEMKSTTYRKEHGFNSVFTSSTIILRSVLSKFLSAMLMREKESKSSISFCIRAAADCILLK